MNFDIKEDGLQLEVCIALNTGSFVETKIAPPEGDVSFVDILPEIFSISDAVLESQLKGNAAGGVSASCSNGCAICCHQLITMSIHEALLLAHIVELLNQPERSRIIASFHDIISSLEKEQILGILIDAHANSFDDRDNIISLQKKYWELHIPCPFLVESSCSIYPYRPFICRQYIVSSDPRSCNQVFGSENAVRRIVPTYDFASAAASFDGEEAINTRAVPLPVVLMTNGMLSYFPRPKGSAAKMIASFLNHLNSLSKA